MSTEHPSEEQLRRLRGSTPQGGSAAGDELSYSEVLEHGLTLALIEAERSDEAAASMLRCVALFCDTLSSSLRR